MNSKLRELIQIWREAEWTTNDIVYELNEASREICWDEEESEENE